MSSLLVNDEDVERIKQIPQRTPAWKQKRFGRLTASNFGSAAGHNKYCSPSDLVRETLWSIFQGNDATRYGSEREQVCCDIYEMWMRKKYPGSAVWVQHQGLWVVKQLPMFGLSVDGLIHIDDKVQLLEIKCPFRKRFYDPIPHYYADQIQGIMGFLDVMGTPVDYAHFVVYTPDATRVEKYSFQADYFYNELLPTMLDWYRNQFLPALILYEDGQLVRGEVRPVMEIGFDEDGELIQKQAVGEKPEVLVSNPEVDNQIALDQEREEAETTERIHTENILYWDEVELDDDGDDIQEERNWVERMLSQVT